MQVSSNLNSKRTVLPKPAANLDAKVKAPEPDQASVQTAPVSDGAEKCAAAEANQVEAVKLNETIVETVAEPEAQETKVDPVNANVAEAQEVNAKPAEVTEEKPEIAEVKLGEVAATEEAKPAQKEVAEEVQPVEIVETKESKKRSIEEISNQDTELL